MGSPLSPVLSNFFMEYFECELLPTILDVDIPWFRYVDDVFSICNLNDNDFDVFFRRLNELSPSIKFSFEWENNNQLPFLDILIVRKWGMIFTDIFRKATHCNTYIHYFSYHDESIKLSVLSSLFLRAYRICTPCFLDKEIDLLFGIFSKLGYPIWFIRKAHFKARKSFYAPRQNVTPFQKPAMVFPFVKELKSTVQNLNILGIKTVFNYPNTIGKSVMRNSPKNDNEIGVYKIPCKRCPQVYVGESGRSFDIRLNEHKQAVSHGNTSNALFLHMSENNHQINWQGAELLIKENNTKKRKIIESAIINSCPTMNISDGSYKLDVLTTNYVLEATNMLKTVKQMNSSIVN